MSCVPTLKYKTPIRRNFSRTIGICFSVRDELGRKIALNLALYDLLFGIKPSPYSPQSEVVYPSISTPSPSSGWAFFTFSGVQTLAMKPSVWYGNILAREKATSNISHEFNIEICVEDCISLP